MHAVGWHPVPAFLFSDAIFLPMRLAAHVLEFSVEMGGKPWIAER